MTFANLTQISEGGSNNSPPEELRLSTKGVGKLDLLRIRGAGDTGSSIPRSDPASKKILAKHLAPQSLYLAQVMSTVQNQVFQVGG